jgi:hypothetical protein
VFDKGGQYFEWLLLDSDPHAVLSKFARVEVNLEDAKAKASSLMIASEHEGKPVERECITRPRRNKASEEDTC